LRNVGERAILNFASFAVIAMAIGGDALNGKVVFVANHGRFAEVSGGILTDRLRHARSLFITRPAGAISWWCTYCDGGSGTC